MNDDHRDEIVHIQLDTNSDSPAVEIARVVADLESRDPVELTTVWDCIDDVVGEVFSTPPAPEAQVEITFTYEGYRITVEQTGRAKLVQTG